MGPKYLTEEILKNVVTGNPVIVMDFAYREDLDMYEYLVYEGKEKLILPETNLKRV